MTIKLPLGFAGKYQFEAFKQDANGEEIAGSRRVVLPWFDNLITDVGMNQLGSGGSPQDNLLYCRIGTGTATPANSNQALGTQTGATNTAGTGGAVGVSMDGTYVYRRVSKRFAAGTISGVNLAEVGMSYTNTGNTLFSRALLKDLAGDPTTITLLADEVLDVIYELRLYLPAQDIVVNTTIDGVASTVTIRRATLNAQMINWANRVGFSFSPLSEGDEQAYPTYSEYTGSANAIAAATGWQVSNMSVNATRTIPTYVADSYTKAVKLVFPIANANFAGGIGFVTIGTSGTSNADTRWHCSFGPWGLIFSPKLNKTAARTATVDFAIVWSRYAP